MSDNTAPAPSGVTEEGVWWLHASSPQGRSYFEEHDVLRPTETTEEHLLDSNYDTVREIDEEALEKQKLGGKWNVFRRESEIDVLWEDVKRLVRENRIRKAKVSTKWSREETGREEFVVVVYTPNYLDTDDVYRVRGVLRSECDVEEEIYYKPNLYTSKNIYADTAREMGLPGASRFKG